MYFCRGEIFVVLKLIELPEGQSGITGCFVVKDQEIDGNNKIIRRTEIIVMRRK